MTSTAERVAKESYGRPAGHPASDVPIARGPKPGEQIKPNFLKDSAYPEVSSGPSSSTAATSSASAAHLEMPSCSARRSALTMSAGRSSSGHGRQVHAGVARLGAQVDVRVLSQVAHDRGPRRCLTDPHLERPLVPSAWMTRKVRTPSLASRRRAGQPGVGPFILDTNPLERVNREIARRSDVIGIYPNDAALLRLAAGVLVEINGEWLVAHRYLSQVSMALLTPNDRGPGEAGPPALEEGALAGAGTSTT